MSLPRWSFTAVLLFKVGYAVVFGLLLAWPASLFALRYASSGSVPEVGRRIEK